MFTCWMAAAAIGLGSEVGSVKGLDWTEPETEELGLDAIGEEAAEKLDRWLS
jgi:hypothetical protein